MAINVAQFTSAGFDRMEYGVLDPDGYFIGTSTALANGADAGSGRLLGVNTADVSIPEPRIVPVTGDNGAISQYQFDDDTFPAFSISGGVYNQTLDSLVTSTTRQAIGDITVQVLNPQDPVYRQMSLLMVSDAQSQDSGTVGSAGFHHLLIMKSNMSAQYTGGFGNAEAQANNYNVNVTRSGIFSWGTAITDADNGTTGATMAYWYAENRMTRHAFVGDGATTTFTLDETAFSDTDGGKNLLWINGVLQTITTNYTLSTTAGVTTVTMVIAPSAGERVQMLYEYSA